MSDFWSVFVIVLVVGNILGMVWLLMATSRSNDLDDKATTGHKWDGIEELNNPLPRWWLGLFIITIVFGVAYLYVYPGLGSYEGQFGWTQKQAYEQAKAANEAKREAFYAEFADIEIPALAKSERAMTAAERLFANNCATCHGSDGGGAKGFPNLTDADWLYANDPVSLVSTLVNGRAGVMPNLNLSDADVAILSYYVKHLAGEEGSEHVQREGQKRFATCAACHGADGKGNKALGAPNLTDDIWLHGGRIADIETILRNGKQGNMPSFRSTLTDPEINLLAAYVLSISAQDEMTQANSSDLSGAGE